MAVRSLSSSSTLLLIAALISSMQPTTPARHQPPDEEREEFDKHWRNVNEFECRQPQRRSVRVKELIAYEIRTNEIIIPHSTVLHRCDGAGCCSDRRMECKMKVNETVDLRFYIIDAFTKKGNYRIFQFINHTLCSCQISVT